MPFGRLKVRLKTEIVTMNVPGLDPAREAGATVAPADWNAIVDDPATVVIDTPNDFEIGYGSFAGAINPQTKNLGDSSARWSATIDIGTAWCWETRGTVAYITLRPQH